MSRTRLSLADLWAKSSLCLEWGNQQNILSADISGEKKSLVGLWEKITGLLERASGD